MKSVGEVMSIGRTFPEALQKAARSLETGREGLVSLLDRIEYRALDFVPSGKRDLVNEAPPMSMPAPRMAPASDGELLAVIRKLVGIPTADRLFYVADALRVGITAKELFDRTAIDPWFLAQLERIVGQERAITEAGELSSRLLFESKRLGFSDRQIAKLRNTDEATIRALREQLGVHAVFGRVDTCAAEFVAETPYLYSTYETESEALVSDRKKVIILGGGPNRIGQGIEFDYCCCHAVYALRELGIETIMVNCNPETVSTDYDTSDRLYFEPLTLEDVLNICREESKKGELLGVIPQFGGQTPLKLAVPLEKAGIRLLGTSADAIDRAEDRRRFDDLLNKLGLKRPDAGIAKTLGEARTIAKRIGYPVLVRPSYVLGGRAMMGCWCDEELEAYVGLAIEAARDDGVEPTLLIDHFLEHATEVDVDCVSDGQRAVIGGVMQHIEEAGVHSGDSTSVLPPHTLDSDVVQAIEEQARALALEIGVVGLMNVQFAVKDRVVYVLEVNPRASRTVPFVSKATGRPLAKIAAKVMAGVKLDELGIFDVPQPTHMAVKESVLPFSKFAGVDTILGPEMRSTGEVMGIATTTALAFSKSQTASGFRLPNHGRAFISVKDDDKRLAVQVARRLRNLGYSLVATGGTARVLETARIPVDRINKVLEGSPHVVDAIRDGTVQLVINTTQETKAIRDSYSIRRSALLANIPYFTTIAAGLAIVDALEARALMGKESASVRSLQEWHQRSKLAEGHN